MDGELPGLPAGRALLGHSRPARQLRRRSLSSQYSWSHADPLRPPRDGHPLSGNTTRPPQARARWRTPQPPAPRTTPPQRLSGSIRMITRSGWAATCQASASISVWGPLGRGSPGTAPRVSITARSQSPGVSAVSRTAAESERPKARSEAVVQLHDSQTVQPRFSAQVAVQVHPTGRQVQILQQPLHLAYHDFASDGRVPSVWVMLASPQRPSRHPRPGPVRCRSC
jgi:hypothetical protein